MKRFTVTILVALFGLSVTVSAVYAELAKEGSGEYRSGRSAKVKVLKLGKDRMQINFDETGVVVDAPADSPFYNASFNTMGTILVVNGQLTYNGAALWTRPNGDQIYGTFKGKGILGQESSGFLEIVGGQGECAGITGTLKLKSGPYTKSSKKGYSMGTTVGTIQWKIP
jgi:hypothetical protein